MEQDGSNDNGLDHIEVTVLGRCVEDYCGSAELLWTLRSLIPALSNRAVLVRRGVGILEKLLLAGLIAPYVRVGESSSPFAPADGDPESIVAAVEREQLLSPDGPSKQSYWFAATPSGVAVYFEQRESAG